MALLQTFSLLVNLAMAEEPTYTFSGRAFNKKGETAYLEKHQIWFSKNTYPNKVITEYLRPSGEKFAEIKSTVEHNPFIPTTEFIDTRFDIYEYFKMDKNQEIKMQRKNKGQLKEKNFTLDGTVVAGQGFHNFLLTNFNQLQSAKEIKFLIAPRLDYFTFEIVETKPSKPQFKRFKLNLSNWLLSKIVGPIEAEYDDKKRLVYYKGLTNIEDDRGKSQELEITYSYDK